MVGRPRRHGWLVALVLVAGCSLFRGGPGAFRTGVTAEELVTRMTERRAAVTSLRARARLKAGLAGMWTREAVLVRRPSDVRVDVLSPFGLALALGASADRLWVYPPAQGVRFEGASSPENLSRFLGAPVEVTDLVDILLGMAPARVPSGDPEIAVVANDEYRLTITFDGGVQTLWFAGDTLDLRRAEEHRGESTVLTVAFDDYRDGFPHALAVTAPVVGSSVQLAYDDVETNASIDAALFLPPPAPRTLPLESAATSS
ncbi:MAG TPA: hypothetical protein VGR62_12645 [Candidatus Binatia bacterium]|jgi:hypothetical protein|nr:hypothetical protein [Candidatus Binatia bacterium]